MPHQPASPYEDLVALYARYTEAAARDLKAWPDLFTDDCLYQVLSRENVLAGRPQPLLICAGRGMVRDRATAYLQAQVQRPQILRYMLSGIAIVDADETGLTARADVEAIRTLDNELPEIIFTGEYQDRIERHDSGPLFREKTCVYDSSIVPTALAAPL